MYKQFPRTEVAGVSLPRFLIGSNWFLGFSHKSAATDKRIREQFTSKEDFFPIFEEYMKHGINAVMGIPSMVPLFADAIKYAEDKLGKEIIIIDTPMINVNDNAAARKETQELIKKSAEIGAKFCLIHHSSIEALVCKNTKTIDRISDYTEMIREAGMIPGATAHMPEIIIYSDMNNYDIQTYTQPYNSAGFLMQVEVEYIAKIINDSKKPVMTIKPMAAGRLTPYTGFNFVWNTIREQDMVTVGVMSPQEAAESVEISFAAIERRFPDVEGRTSVNTNQDAFGK